MRWAPIIEKAQDEDEWFRQYVASVIATPAPRLPETSQRIGNSSVTWWETTPGRAFIHAYGGTPDDRVLGTLVVRGQLQAHGIRQAQYTFDPEHKTATWDDVMAKAKRLIQSNQVQVLRNGYNNVVGHVVGDHGEYQTEIGRDDPNSRAITTWQCECPWDQYAWQRTRQWKKYEGRPCHLPGSMITMSDGSYKKIEEIQVGDKVITHDGIGVVSQTMERPYEGPIYSIYRAGFPYPLRITENHEVWAVETPESIRNVKYNLVGGESQGFRIYDDSFVAETPSWVDAQDLRVHDWVASTWMNEELETASIPFATLFGYYLAEGNLAKRTRSDIWGEVQWTLHRDEVDLHNEIYKAIEDLGLKARTYYPRGTKTVSIRTTSRYLAERFYDLGGHLASHKRLSPEVMQWSRDLQEAMVRAWANGDGDVKSDGRQAINTSSEHLARSMYDVIVRLGFIPSWQIIENNGGPEKRSEKRTIHRILFKWHKTGKANSRRRYEDRYMSKVTRIVEDWYSGPVYNMSVSDQESYVSEGVTNHNCAHVLATYWKALATPLDEDVNPATGQPTGQGQLFNVPRTAPAPVPFKAPAPAPQPQNQQMQIPGMFPGQATGTPPDPNTPVPSGPGIIPPFPMQNAGQPLPVSVPGGRPPTPGNPMNYPGGTFSSVQDWNFEQSWNFDRLSKVSDFTPQPDGFQSGNMVSTKHDDWGIWVGKSEEHGAGSQAKIPKGSVGEVMSQDPTTKMVQVLFMDKKLGVQEFGKLMPYGATAWFFESELELRPDVQRPGPAIKRR